MISRLDRDIEPRPFLLEPERLRQMLKPAGETGGLGVSVLGD